MGNRNLDTSPFMPSESRVCSEMRDRVTELIIIILMRTPLSHCAVVWPLCRHASPLLHVSATEALGSGATARSR